MKRRRLGLALAAVTLLATALTRCGACDGRPLRVGTYNIREFGEVRTDMDRLVTTIAKTDADVLAVQEIQRPAKLQDLARRLSQGARRYEVALSRCGGASAMRLGVLYDSARVRVKDTVEYPELDPDESGQCTRGERPGFAARLEPLRGGERPFWLLVVHLAARGDRDKFELRKAQWRRAHQIATRLGAGGDPVAILGDTNSTGWLDGRYDERKFIEDEAAAAGKVVATRDLACSEYWQPGGGHDGPAARLEVSLLDHVVAPPGFVRRGSVEVHSFCRELSCKRTSERPRDYDDVSDHCPVTFDLR